MNKIFNNLDFLIKTLEALKTECTEIEHELIYINAKRI
ncbi:MAG: hypothetical protein ACI8QQ_002398 [Psychroserpens sp.]|jgi:hypothetical protein